MSIDLAHPWVSRGIGPPHPSGTPHRHPWAPPEHSLSTPGHSRGTFEYKNRGSSRDFCSRGETRIMYSFALGQPGQSGQISFRGEGNVKQLLRFELPMGATGWAPLASEISNHCWYKPGSCNVPIFEPGMSVEALGTNREPRGRWSGRRFQSRATESPGGRTGLAYVSPSGCLGNKTTFPYDAAK